MSRKKKNKSAEPRPGFSRIPDSTRKAVLVILFVVLGCFLSLAGFGGAGVAGTDVYNGITYLVGIGYFLFPILSFLLAGTMIREEKPTLEILKGTVSVLFLLSGLGLIDILAGHGGLLGDFLGKKALYYFSFSASLMVLGGICLISLLILLGEALPFGLLASFGRGIASFGKRVFERTQSDDEGAPELHLPEEPQEEVYEDDVQEEIPMPIQKQVPHAVKNTATLLKTVLGTYTPPPLSLLEHDQGRPGVGDVKANANIIKRTLQNFGITVELDEISIGPSVTRYAIKPAEGVRLQKIISLQTNLELALAAHPVRIEAPIPGKSLVGIEVQNHAKVTVGLGTLLEAKEFAESHKPLLVALGRDIAGGSHFGNVAKMPHALIAGATGSGKSVTIHVFITSLLYRCGPQQLRFLMIDPKRVELTLYNRLPHLLCPVITDAKKAIMALRWAGKEMERRYNILEAERVRDIESYHQNILAPALETLRKKGGSVENSEETVPEGMPYIVIVIDELADIMQSYPRELEAAVVRLAQMSRAVGIHLLISTQRPSVNVITGLIKANVPCRVALQVASQIDSRTILDQSGAEKLLGAGDMLYLSGDMGKPVRLQSAFISENEVKKVTDFIVKHNEAHLPIDIAAPHNTENDLASVSLSDSDEEIDDDMYEAAYATVIEAGKASTSYLQRKLRLGYARAARLMDVLEERGVIGPQDGAKPREVLPGGGGTHMSETE